jgi:hypothetical protein
MAEEALTADPFLDTPVDESGDGESPEVEAAAPEAGTESVAAPEAAPAGPQEVPPAAPPQQPQADPYFIPDLGQAMQQTLYPQQQQYYQQPPQAPPQYYQQHQQQPPQPYQAAPSPDPYGAPEGAFQPPQLTQEDIDMLNAQPGEGLKQVLGRYNEQMQSMHQQMQQMAQGRQQEQQLRFEANRERVASAAVQAEQGKQKVLAQIANHPYGNTAEDRMRVAKEARKLLHTWSSRGFDKAYQQFNTDDLDAMSDERFFNSLMHQAVAEAGVSLVPGTRLTVQGGPQEQRPQGAQTEQDDGMTPEVRAEAKRQGTYEQLVELKRNPKKHDL